MLLFVEISPVLTAAVSGTDVYDAVGTLSFFATFALMYFAAAAFVRWEGGRSVTELGLAVDSRTNLLLAVGAIAGAIAAGFVVLMAVLFGGQLRPVSEITGDLVISEIIITTPVALFEELCYRGYLVSRMTKLWGLPAGICTSSLVFSLLHFNWWLPLGSVPYLLVAIFAFNMFLGGVVLGLTYYLSGNRLWAPIAFHLAWNMIAYILFPIYPQVPVVAPELFQIEWGVTTIPGFVLGFLVLLLFLKRQKMEKK
jgi:membrane protease YdiL (CAAX protease family)